MAPVKCQCGCMQSVPSYWILVTESGKKVYDVCYQPSKHGKVIHRGDGSKYKE